MHDPKEVLEICEKATEGPWYGLEDAGVFADPEHRKPIFETGCGCCTRPDLKTEDADFIALARTALPQFAQRVIELEGENAKLRAVVTDIKNYFDNPQKYGGTWPEFYSAVIKQALADLESRLHKELDSANESNSRLDAELYRITIEKEQAEADNAALVEKCTALLERLRQTEKALELAVALDALKFCALDGTEEKWPDYCKDPAKTERAVCVNCWMEYYKAKAGDSNG